MAYRIRNVRGTSQRRGCQCGSWLDHFRRHGGTTNVCVGCGSKRILGAHVFVEEFYFGLFEWRKRGEFILPLCNACNASTDWIRVQYRAELVSANTQKMGCAIRAR